MGISGLSGGYASAAAAQAQWDAIASIKSTSPFASQSAPSKTSSVADGLDSLMDTYTARVSGATGGDSGAAAVLERVLDAQRSTIDLFA